MVVAIRADLAQGLYYLKSNPNKLTIFRCTINRIPETNSLLQKSRLPLGILIHPFKDLNPFVFEQRDSAAAANTRHCAPPLCSRDYPTKLTRHTTTAHPPVVGSLSSKRAYPLWAQERYNPEDPNARSSKDVAHLNPATDFYKRIALDCSGAQVAVDLFLLSSQYSDLATLSGCKHSLLLLFWLEKQSCEPSCTSTQCFWIKPTLGSEQTKHVLAEDGRLTASKLYEAAHCKTDGTLVRQILGGYKVPETKAIKRGKVLEKPVIEEIEKKLHIKVESSGGMSKFSGGTVYHFPLFRGARAWQAAALERTLTRYLTRKIGFEAVMRVRCTSSSRVGFGSCPHPFKRTAFCLTTKDQKLPDQFQYKMIRLFACSVTVTTSISIHTFHGNFFVRSTDLLSLPNVSPDAGFGMQLAIDESLADLQQVCFQAALLYTSSKAEATATIVEYLVPGTDRQRHGATIDDVSTGERRIRVHTLALPTASTLTDVLHSADQLCIVGLLSKMASSLLPPASCLLPPASCLLPPASCLLSPTFSQEPVLSPPLLYCRLYASAIISSILIFDTAARNRDLVLRLNYVWRFLSHEVRLLPGAVDRCASASMSEAREALINVAVDALSAHRLAQNLPAGAVSAALHAPASLRLLPLYLLALLKRALTDVAGQNLPAGAVSAALHAPASLRLLPLYLLALLKRNLPAGAVSAALHAPASLRLLPLYLLALLKRNLPAGAVSAALHAPASLRLLPLYLLALLKRNLPAGAVSAALHAPASLRLLPLYLLALLKRNLPAGAVSAALHAPASLRLLPLYLLALLKRNLPAGAVSAALHAPASLRLLPLYLLALLKRNLPAGAVSAALHAPASLRLLPLYLLALLKRNLPAGAVSAALHAPASLRLLPLYLLALLKRNLPAGAVSAALHAPASLRLLPLYLLALLKRNLPAGAVSAALHAPASLRLLPLYLLALLKRVSTITPRVAMWSMTGSDRRGWPRTCPLAPSAPRSTRPASLRLLPLYLLALLKRNLPAGAVSAALHAPASLRLLPLYLLALLKRNLPAGAVSAALHAPASLRLLPLYLLALLKRNLPAGAVSAALHAPASLRLLPLYLLALLKRNLPAGAVSAALHAPASLRLLPLYLLALLKRNLPAGAVSAALHAPASLRLLPLYLLALLKRNLPAGAVSAALHAPASLRLLPLYLLALLKRNLPAGAVSAALHAPASLRLLPLYLLALLKRNLPAGAVSAALHAPASLRLLPLYLLALLKRSALTDVAGPDLPAGAVSAALTRPPHCACCRSIAGCSEAPRSTRRLTAPAALYLLALLKRNLPAGAVSAALHAPASLRLLPLYLLALLKRVSTIIPRVAMWSMTGSDRRGWPEPAAGAVSAALHAPASLRLLPLYLLALLKRNLPAGAVSAALHAPASLRLLPLYLLALLKRALTDVAGPEPASRRLLSLYLLGLLKRGQSACEAAMPKLRAPFRTGTSTRLDDRVGDMCALKTLPLSQLARAVYPALYPVLDLHQYVRPDDPVPDPPQLHLSAQSAPLAGRVERKDTRNVEHSRLVLLLAALASGAVFLPTMNSREPVLVWAVAKVAKLPTYPEIDSLQATGRPGRISVNGAYLLDDGETFIIYVCHGASPAYLSDTFGVAAFSQLPDEARALPALDSEGSELLHALLDRLNEERAVESGVLLLRSVPPPGPASRQSVPRQPPVRRVLLRSVPPPAASAACAAECGVLLLRSVPRQPPVRRAAAEVSAPASRQCGVLLLRSVPPPAASAACAAESVPRQPPVRRVLLRSVPRQPPVRRVLLSAPHHPRHQSGATVAKLFIAQRSRDDSSQQIDYLATPAEPDNSPSRHLFVERLVDDRVESAFSYYESNEARAATAAAEAD
ncbi:hypothetical protein MSG28_007265 [Choristoneura fumiferana]|uniref:Uncharacterized protein n=1 Tax=Choristoneura fumiferana TaxID=7141 RepID=A0ACC0JX01_CHOFU|nr:hypothetical protein MSG28_007265 [Choristoneura fumiferana]